MGSGGPILTGRLACGRFAGGYAIRRIRRVRLRLRLTILLCLSL
jgi:hypothetical protein